MSAYRHIEMLLLPALLWACGCIDEPTEVTAPTPPFGVIDTDDDRFRRPALPDDALPRQVEGNTGFATDLYGAVAEGRTDENIAIAPLAVSLAAIQLHVGAAGSTAGQLESAFRFELERANLYPAFNRLERAVSRPPADAAPRGQALTMRRVDNRWLERGSNLRRDYRETLTRQFDAAIHVLNFQPAPDEARRTINDWVAAQTVGRLTGPLAAGALDAETRLVASTAALPAGNWRFPFDNARTEAASFTRPDGTAVDVDLMRLDRREGFRFATGDDWRAAELPYLGGSFALLVILPDAGRLEAVEARLSADWLASLVDRLADRPLSVGLPRFDVADRHDLKPLLTMLGATDLFDPARADLSGLSPDPDLAVDAFGHQTRLTVDELGANTTNPVEETASDDLSDGAVELTADRPFLFAIRHRPTNSFVLLGRLTRPGSP